MSNTATKVLDMSKYRKKRASTSRSQKEFNPRPTRLPASPLLGDDIQRAKEYLLYRPTRYGNAPVNFRDYTWFSLGVNTGMRAGDLFSLKVKDILDHNGEVVDRIHRVMQKNRKPQEIAFRPEVQELLQDWLDILGDWEPDWYLFHPMWPANPYRQYDIRDANKVLKRLQTELNIKNPLSTHTMRKTLARSTYERLVQDDNPEAIQIVMQMLGHSSETVTKRYLGITREEVRAAYLMGDMI